MKICSCCRVEKEFSDFQIRQASKDGLTARCKGCLSEYDRLRANLPHRVKARKEYAKTPAGILAGNRAKKEWSDNNIIKKGASQLVNNAVRDGRLTKPLRCSYCDALGRIEGHHEDYEKPLEVIWLCSSCHRQEHKQ